MAVQSLHGAGELGPWREKRRNRRCSSRTTGLEQHLSRSKGRLQRTAAGVTSLGPLKA